MTQNGHFSTAAVCGNYSRETIRILASLQPENQYFLYTPKRSEGSLFTPPAGSTARLPAGLFYSVFHSAWRSSGIIRDLIKDSIELFHGLSNEIPLNINKSGIKSVVTIHDLIFLTHPQYYKLIDRAIYKKKLFYSASQADAVIAVSKKTKDDIETLLGIDSRKIFVVYQGCNPVFSRLTEGKKRADIAIK